MVLAFIGLFSYSLYATHTCTLKLVGVFLANPQSKPVSLVPLLVGVTVSIAFAWLFFQGVERWSLHLPGGKRPVGMEAKPGRSASIATCPLVPSEASMSLPLSEMDNSSSDRVGAVRARFVNRINGTRVLVIPFDFWTWWWLTLILCCYPLVRAWRRPEEVMGFPVIRGVDVALHVCLLAL